MPTYEYQCQQCKYRFEKMQRFTDTPLKQCPRCHGLLKKLLFAPPVLFKGTGWYKTDSKIKVKKEKSEKKKVDKPKKISTHVIPKKETSSTS